MRLPIVMVVANRALSGPINIHCDHSDAMGARDTGWIQLFGENVQEAYDNSMMAFRMAEHMDVRMPMMTCLDGFIVTHCPGTIRAIARRRREVVRRAVQVQAVAAGPSRTRSPSGRSTGPITISSTSTSRWRR